MLQPHLERELPELAWHLAGCLPMSDSVEKSGLWQVHWKALSLAQC